MCFWSKCSSCPCLFVLHLTLWTSLGAPENKQEELFWEHTNCNLAFSPRDQVGATTASVMDVLFKNNQPFLHLCSFNFKCLAPLFSSAEPLLLICAMHWCSCRSCGRYVFCPSREGCLSRETKGQDKPKKISYMRSCLHSSLHHAANPVTVNWCLLKVHKEERLFL